MINFHFHALRKYFPLTFNSKLEELGIQEQGKRQFSQYTSQKYISSFLTFTVKEKTRSKSLYFHCHYSSHRSSFS